MKRYTFSIVLMVLLVAAFFLCVILFQKKTTSEGESFLVSTDYQSGMQEAHNER